MQNQSLLARGVVCSLLFLVLGFFESVQSWAFEALPKTAPVSERNPVTRDKVLLGKQLYFDTRLSMDDSVSCQTCHDVNKGGVDGLATSKGIKGQLGGRNAPTVWNAAFLSVQFWDGRAKSLEEQAKGPITNPIEMGMPDHDAVIKKLKTIPGYVRQFKKVFGGDDPVTIDHLAMAIATYERTLITPNSPFDRYQRGDKKAMTAQALRGMKTFESVGCVSCHSGPNFSGPSMPEGMGFFQKFPTFPGSKYEEKYELTKDPGRFEVTHKVEDRGFWRVPTLRNVALTAPYFHNGKVKHLNEAVRVMAKTQLNRTLKKNEVQEIVAFLRSLTGKVPKQVAPKLPK